MGTLRTLLAISVVCAHTYGYILIGGRNAVQMFYIISGFLISYVLVEQKGYSNIKIFYLNRFLRIYPIYLIVAIATFLVYCLFWREDFFGIYERAPLSANLLLAASNLFLFFQDWVMFAGVTNNQLIFSSHFADSEIILWKGLLAPQCWSISVEASFYLLAPFILPNKKAILCTLLLSLAFRAYLVMIGLGLKDPWIYRFPPTELALFLLGAISHQFISPLYKSIFSPRTMKALSSIVTFTAIIIVLVFWLIPIRDMIKSAILLTVFIFCLPFLSLFQANRNWDKRVGELSYPIYLVHMLAIYATTLLASTLKIVDPSIISITSILLSTLLAIALNSFAGNSIESFRLKFKAGGSVPSGPQESQGSNI